MSKVSEGIPGTWEYQQPPEPRNQPFTRTELRLGKELGLEGVERYMIGNCQVFVTLEPAGHGGLLLWHLSISHPRRHPTWDEIKWARYRLLPHGLNFAIFLPPPDEYVNVPEQDHVFHIWECPDPRG